MYDIALIGGGGYVGSAVLKYFDKLGAKILVVDNFIYDHSVTNLPYLQKPNIDFLNCDFASQTDVIISELEKCNSIVILGGLVGDPITKRYPDESDFINGIGMNNLLTGIDSKLSGKRVLFISTCSNYGLMTDGELASEKSELRPLSLYSKAKVKAEKLINDEFNMKDNNVYTILRFATAFGLSNRMRFDLTVNQFTRAIALGDELVVFDPDTWRPYCHVNDFALLIEKVINAAEDCIKGQVFNAGGDENNYTKRALIDEILNIVPNGKVHFQNQGDDPRNYKVDFEKVRSLLQFEPKFSVVDGIKEVVQAVNQGFFLSEVEGNNLYGNYYVK